MAKRRAYGRIKSRSLKPHPNHMGPRPFSSKLKKMLVQVKVGRIEYPAAGRQFPRLAYHAEACVAAGKGRWGVRSGNACGRARGRTVQSAVAKALKSLAGRTALRGRKG